MAFEILNQSLHREINIWVGLHHPNIVPFLGTIEDRLGPGVIMPYYPKDNIGSYIRDIPGKDRLPLVRIFTRWSHYKIIRVYHHT